MPHSPDAFRKAFDTQDLSGDTEIEVYCVLETTTPPIEFGVPLPRSFGSGQLKLYVRLKDSPDIIGNTIMFSALDSDALPSEDYLALIFNELSDSLVNTLEKMKVMRAEEFKKAMGD